MKRPWRVEFSSLNFTNGEWSTYRCLTTYADRAAAEKSMRYVIRLKSRQRSRVVDRNTAEVVAHFGGEN